MGTRGGTVSESRVDGYMVLGVYTYPCKPPEYQFPMLPAPIGDMATAVREQVRAQAHADLDADLMQPGDRQSYVIVEVRQVP
jgi:hypothetical protein